VQLMGTASGYFALGAFMVGPAGATVLGAGEGEQPANEPAATPITTADGQIAAASELYYEVIVNSPAQAPEVRFDAATTRSRAVERLERALGGTGTLLGASDPNDTAALAALAEQALGPIDRELALALLVQLGASA
jgi:hypothetical protein